MPALIIVLSGLVAAAGWFGRWWSTRLLLSVLVASVTVTIAGVLAGARLYPLTDILVLLLVLSGGMLLGRVIPPGFWPFFLLLLVLSALDGAQQLLPGGPVSHGSTRPAGYFYTMFVLDIGTAHSAIGFADLILAAAMGEHGRRRGQSLWRGILPAPIGLLVADVLDAMTSAGSIPLIPFMTLGWLLVQIPWTALVVRVRPAARSIRGSSAAARRR